MHRHKWNHWHGRPALLRLARPHPDRQPVRGCPYRSPCAGFLWSVILSSCVLIFLSKVYLPFKPSYHNTPSIYRLLMLYWCPHAIFFGWYTLMIEYLSCPVMMPTIPLNDDTPQRARSNPCTWPNRSGSLPLHRISHRYSLARAQRSAPATYHLLARMLVGRGHIDQCDTDRISGASLSPRF